MLRDLFPEHKLGRRVRLGVANQRIVMRTLDLPPMREAKEIASAVRFQAQEHIPMPLEQAVLEHQSLGVVETADGPADARRARRRAPRHDRPAARGDRAGRGCARTESTFRRSR